MNFDEGIFNRIGCHAWLEYEDYMFMCAYDKNLICKISKSTGQIEIIGKYPHTAMGKESLSASVQRIDDKVVFCPFAADYIAIYDITLCKIDYIHVPIPQKDGVEYSSDTKFYNSCVHERCVYLFGWTYPAIVEVNIDTYCVRYIDEWLDELVGMKGFSRFDSYFNEGKVKKDNKIYLPMGCIDGVFVFDVTKKKGSVLQISNGDTGYWGMAVCGGCTILTGADGGVYKWDIDDDSVEQIGLLDKKMYRAPIACGEDVLICTGHTDEMYFFNLNNSYYEKAKQITKFIGTRDYILCGQYRDGILKFVTKSKRLWYTYDLSRKEIRKNYYSLDDEKMVERCWESRCELLKEKDGIYREEEIPLEEFISFVNTTCHKGAIKNA